MSNDDAGDSSARGSSHDSHDEDSLIDRVFPENLKRRIEAGVDSVLRDRRIKHFVEELKLPKEIVNHAKAQIDETKRTAIEVIARETREFLEKTNLADELANLLTQVSLQVEVRFVPNLKAIKGTGETDTGRKGIFNRSRTSKPQSDEAQTAKDNSDQAVTGSTSDSVPLDSDS